MSTASCILRFSVQYPVSDPSSSDGDDSDDETTDATTAVGTCTVEIPKSEFTERRLIERTINRADCPQCASVPSSRWDDEFEYVLDEELTLSPSAE